MNTEGKIVICQYPAGSFYDKKDVNKSPKLYEAINEYYEDEHYGRPLDNQEHNIITVGGIHYAALFEYDLEKTEDK